MKNYITEILNNNDGTHTATLVDEENTVVAYITVGEENLSDLYLGEFPKPGLAQRLSDWWNS